VLGTVECLHRSVGRTTSAIEASTKRCQHLGHVPYQIVIDLAFVYDHHPGSLRRQCRFKVFDPESGQAVPVLDDNGRDAGVGQQAGQLAPPAVHPRADLGHYAVDCHARSGDPLGEPGHLSVEVASLIVTGDTSIDDGTPGAGLRPSGDLNQDRPRRGADSGHRKLSISEPPPGGLVVNSL